MRPAELAERLDPAQQQNIDAYLKELDGLLDHSRDKFVVFADARLVKICDTLEAALKLGYQKFGRDPFLVQRVEPLVKAAG